MADLRTVLAAVLGVGIGLVFIAFPDAVIRAQTVGRLPDGRGGRYGSATTPAPTWRRLVQAIGLAMFLGGGYFAATALGLIGGL